MLQSLGNRFLKIWLFETLEKKHISFLNTYLDLLLSASAAVLESIGTFKVIICRHGKLTSTVKVRVETIDGSANEGEDYHAINEVLTFEPLEREKQV